MLCSIPEITGFGFSKLYTSQWGLIKKNQEIVFKDDKHGCELNYVTHSKKHLDHYRTKWTEQNTERIYPKPREILIYEKGNDQTWQIQDCQYTDNWNSREMKTTIPNKL